MFSLNESWQQPEFKGEIELHKALFEGTGELSVDTDAHFRPKKTKRRKLGKRSRDVDIEEVPVEAEMGKVDGDVSVKSGKRKKRKMKTEKNSSKCKKTRVEQDSTGAADSCATSLNSRPSVLNSTDSCSEHSPKKRVCEKRKTSLQSKMASKMEGARFRWINEQLYTTTGKEAKQMFDQDPALFDVYHSGFATQVSKWPLNPLDKIIMYVQSLPLDFVIADFGCGRAELAQNVSQTVHSFDLVAANGCVTACDMAHVPLAKSSVDVAVFCLSLMGSNTSDFIREARRVLKKGGLLKICEIASRLKSIDDFVTNVEQFGFKLIKMDTLGKMFIDFEFREEYKKRESATTVPTIHLNPCIYKRR